MLFGDLINPRYVCRWFGQSCTFPLINSIILYLYITIISGLGIRSLVFHANRSFFDKKSTSLFIKSKLLLCSKKLKQRTTHFDLFALFLKSYESDSILSLFLKERKSKRANSQPCLIWLMRIWRSWQKVIELGLLAPEQLGNHCGWQRGELSDTD